MPVIACELGSTRQAVGGTVYVFHFDERYQAHIAHVHNLTHAACFLSVEHYEEASLPALALGEGRTDDAPKVSSPMMRERFLFI